MISAIVLAAGSSRRMGSINKMLISYKGKAIVAQVVENILAAGIKDLMVVVGFEADRITRSLQGLPVKLVFNANHNSGLTSSIQEGVRQASGNGYMICLADMILIEPEEYSLMCKSFEQLRTQDPRCICQPVYNKQKGNPVIFSSHYKEAMLAHEDTEGCKEIVRDNKEHVFGINMGSDHILRDIDYPHDLGLLNI